MKRKLSNKAFTLFELLSIIAILSLLIIFSTIISGVIMGNQWFFSEDMLKEARLQHPEITELTTYRRHIWSKSPITFKTQDGATVILYLDSNILSNYTFSDQP